MKLSCGLFVRQTFDLISDPCVSEEHEARANADLNKILDLVNPSAGIIAAAVPIALPKNTVADAGTATVVVHDVDPELNVESRNGKKTRPIMSFGGYKLTESPMSLCPSASQETPSIDKLNVKPKHKLNWLQARVSK